MPELPNISKITLPSGTTYNLKDQWARDQIAAIAGGYTKYLGVTTTSLSDGDDTNPVTINGESVTAAAGDIVTHDNKEFIFNGTVWQEFGDLSGLGLLAYKDDASGTFVPNGSITTKTFTGSSTTMSGTFTPSGTITGTSFTGASMTSTGTFTAEGTVSKPTVTPTTDTVKSVDNTAIATAVTGIDSAIKIGGVTNETLSLVLATPTTQAAVGTVDKTVLTAVDVAAPTFTGTSDQSISVTGTTTGTVTNGTFTGTQDDISVTGTPNGTIDVAWTGSSTSVTVE
jgi:hypothetical protein